MMVSNPFPSQFSWCLLLIFSVICFLLKMIRKLAGIPISLGGLCVGSTVGALVAQDLPSNLIPSDDKRTFVGSAAALVGWGGVSLGCRTVVLYNGILGGLVSGAVVLVISMTLVDVISPIHVSKPPTTSSNFRSSCQRALKAISVQDFGFDKRIIEEKREGGFQVSFTIV